MEFKTKKVAERFSIVGDVDQKIEIPGKYKGMLSEIPLPDLVQGMVNRGNNLVEEKTKSPAPKQTGA